MLNQNFLQPPLPVSLPAKFTQTHRTEYKFCHDLNFQCKKELYIAPLRCNKVHLPLMNTIHPHWCVCCSTIRHKPYKWDDINHINAACTHRLEMVLNLKISHTYYVLEVKREIWWTCFDVDCCCLIFSSCWSLYLCCLMCACMLLHAIAVHGLSGMCLWGVFHQVHDLNLDLKMVFIWLIYFLKFFGDWNNLFINTDFHYYLSVT